MPAAAPAADGAGDAPVQRCLHADRAARGRDHAEEVLNNCHYDDIRMIVATDSSAILGIGEPLKGRLLLWNALEMSFRTVKVPRNHECPVCGDKPTITELIDYEWFCSMSH